MIWMAHAERTNEQKNSFRIDILCSWNQTMPTTTTTNSTYIFSGWMMQYLQCVHVCVNTKGKKKSLESTPSAKLNFHSIEICSYLVISGADVILRNSQPDASSSLSVCVCVCVQSNQSDFYFIAHNPMDQRTTIYLKRNINAYCFMLDFFRSVLFILYSIYIHHFVMHHCPSSWFTLPNKYYSISRVYTIYDITIYMDNGQRTIRQWVTIIGHHQFHNHKN